MAHCSSHVAESTPSCDAGEGRDGVCSTDGSSSNKLTEIDGDEETRTIDIVVGADKFEFRFTLTRDKLGKRSSLLRQAENFCAAHNIVGQFCTDLVAARAFCVAGMYDDCIEVLTQQASRKETGDGPGWRVLLDLATSLVPVGNEWPRVLALLGHVRRGMPRGPNPQLEFIADSIYIRALLMVHGWDAPLTKEAAQGGPSAWALRLWEAVLNHHTGAWLVEYSYRPVLPNDTADGAWVAASTVAATARLRRGREDDVPLSPVSNIIEEAVLSISASNTVEWIFKSGAACGSITSLLDNKATLTEVLAKHAPDGGADFYPASFVLPRDREKWESSVSFLGDVAAAATVWAVKPILGADGEGISFWHTSELRGFLSKSHSQLLVQRYVANLQTIRGYKFDFRIFVTVLSLSPIRIHVHDPGYTKYAPLPFSLNLNYTEYLGAHLTNSHSTYRDEAGSACDLPRSTTDALLHIYPGTGNATTRTVVWERIRRAVRFTFAAARDEALRPDTFTHSSDDTWSFCTPGTTFGFDFILDTDGTPWMLEVNAAPGPFFGRVSCPGDPPLDHRFLRTWANIVGRAPSANGPFWYRGARGLRALVACNAGDTSTVVDFSHTAARHQEQNLPPIEAILNGATIRVFRLPARNVFGVDTHVACHDWCRRNMALRNEMPSCANGLASELRSLIHAAASSHGGPMLPAGLNVRMSTPFDANVSSHGRLPRLTQAETSEFQICGTAVYAASEDDLVERRGTAKDIHICFEINRNTTVGPIPTPLIERPEVSRFATCVRQDAVGESCHRMDLTPLKLGPIIIDLWLAHTSTKGLSLAPIAGTWRSIRTGVVGGDFMTVGARLTARGRSFHHITDLSPNEVRSIVLLGTAASTDTTTSADNDDRTATPAFGEMLLNSAPLLALAQLRHALLFSRARTANSVISDETEETGGEVAVVYYLFGRAPRDNTADRENEDGLLTSWLELASRTSYVKVLIVVCDPADCPDPREGGKYNAAFRLTHVAALARVELCHAAGDVEKALASTLTRLVVFGSTLHTPRTPQWAAPSSCVKRTGNSSGHAVSYEECVANGILADQVPTDMVTFSEFANVVPAKARIEVRDEITAMLGRLSAEDALTGGQEYHPEDAALYPNVYAANTPVVAKSVADPHIELASTVRRRRRMGRLRAAVEDSVDEESTFCHVCSTDLERASANTGRRNGLQPVHLNSTAGSSSNGQEIDPNNAVYSTSSETSSPHRAESGQDKADGDTMSVPSSEARLSGDKTGEGSTEIVFAIYGDAGLGTNHDANMCITRGGVVLAALEMERLFDVSLVEETRAARDVW